MTAFRPMHIPESQFVGYSGKFLKDARQTRFTPHRARPIAIVTARANGVQRPLSRRPAIL
jgi:hypothetical protein